jgi:hypothetical protein
MISSPLRLVKPVQHSHDMAFKQPPDHHEGEERTMHEDVMVNLLSIGASRGSPLYRPWAFDMNTKPSGFRSWSTRLIFWRDSSIAGRGREAKNPNHLDIEI